MPPAPISDSRLSSCRLFPAPSALLLAIAGFCVRGALGAAGTDELPESLAALRTRVQSHLAQPRFAHAQFGVHAVSLETGRTLCSANADKLFVPASATKLFTAALALDRLGPGYRIRTSLYGTGRPDPRGRLKGDLVIVGRGDPSLDVAEAGGDWDRALEPLVSVAIEAGVRQVTGDLVADTSYFRGSPFGAGWEHDDLPWSYGAEASALDVNNNAVELVVRPGQRPGLPAEAFLFPSTRHVLLSNFAMTTLPGSSPSPLLEVQRRSESNLIEVRGALAFDAQPARESFAVRQPAAWLAEEFRQALLRRGIRVRGRVVVAGHAPDDRTPRDLASLVELGSVASPPLAAMLPRMLKPSQNLHAQLWLLQVGAAKAGDPEGRLTTEQAGLEELSSFLKEAGISPGEAHFEEGSGLSRHNLVTPRALVELLRHMRCHPASEAFAAALPVAGQDGTLRNRMRGTAAEGRVRAKTGTLSRVHALAGYVTTAAGESVAFAVMLNQYAAPPDRPGRLELDEIAVWLAGLKQPSREDTSESGL